MWAWRKEIFKLILQVLLAAIISFFFIGIKFFLPLLFLILLYALIKQMLLITRLEHWLSSGASGKIPEGSGIWEDIYYHFYRLRKSNKKGKKQLSKMIKQFRQSTDVLPDAAVVLSEETYQIEWSNKLAKEQLGLKKSDKGQRILNLIRLPELNNYLKNHKENDTLIIPSPVNDQLVLQLRLVHYGIGQHLLIAHDVTEQKRMDIMRKNFVANVSHELRTPLTVLKGYLETLQDMNQGESSLLTNSLAQMYGQTERMQYLVDDLLLLARLESNKKKFDFVDVVELIQDICLEIDGLESTPRIDLKINSDAVLYGEEEELRSAFSNLITNALKYSPEGSEVKVLWSKEGDFLYFDVIDNGEGIAPQHIPRVTERFYRVDVKRSRKLSGTGLGLAIVKHVLMRHDAKLEIKSELGVGSHFRCIFPSQ